MSATSFLRVFQKDPQYKLWFDRNQSWLRNNRKELEARGVSKYVGFALTEEAATQLGKKAEFDKLVADVKKQASRRGPYLVDDGINPTTVVFPRVSFEKGIASLLDKYLGVGTAKTASEMKLVKGHVLGIATGGLVGVAESLRSSKFAQTMTKEDVDGALRFIDVIVDHLTEMDMASSTIRDLNSPVFARYSKSSRHFLVELQTKKSNDESAKMVQAISGVTKNATTGIRGVFTPGGAASKALKGLLEELAKQGVNQDTLLQLETSPPLLKLIEDEVIAEISGKSKKLKKEYSGQFNLGDVTLLAETGKKEYQRQLKGEIAKLKQTKAKLQRIRKTTGQYMSPVSLQALINRSLHDQIESNMGKGSARSVLNYRSGRFARSAKVANVQNRQDATEIFYTYMKNPYSTFEPTGAQGIPYSRDPRKLIEKSIRQIAVKAVINRLRMVPV